MSTLLVKYPMRAEGGVFSMVLLVAISSVLFALVHAIIQDFVQTFLNKPKHFKRESWVEFLRKPRVNVPLVKLGENGDYREVLARGSRLYSDRPFKIQHFPGEIVILPYKFIDEVKNAPESKLSFQQGSYDFFLGRHTGITGHEHAMSALIRRDVGRLLDRVYDVVEDEATRAVLSQIGPCEEWTPTLLFPKVVRIIIMISQRVFVGEPLCRDEKWIQCITNVTAGAFQSVPILWRYSDMTRPFVAWRLPGLRGVRKHKEEARRLIRPVLEKRLEDMKDPSFQSPPDLIQLVIDGTKGEGSSLDYQVQAQIGTARAALFTTSVTVFHLLYDLATRAEYIEPLRQEVIELGDVPMNRVNVAKLRKMDSFIRECQRWSKFMLVGTIRKVLVPFKLSDGTELPAGTLIGVDTQNAVFNHSTLEGPDKFDGFRFVKLRSMEGNEQKFQAVSPGADHLVYGYGTQACPGRFFAVHEAKVVLARILKNYEFKLKDKNIAHPMTKANGIVTEANASIMFMFKRRV